MQQLIEFAGNNWLLVTALVAVVVAILVNEARLARAGSSSLDPASATHLFNRQEAVFVDIRGDAEYRKAHLPGALSVPASALTERLGKLEKFKNRPVIVYCNTGMTTAKVVPQLKKSGFTQVYSLKGGLERWRTDGFPTEGK